MMAMVRLKGRLVLLWRRLTWRKEPLSLFSRCSWCGAKTSWDGTLEWCPFCGWWDALPDRWEV